MPLSEKVDKERKLDRHSCSKPKGSGPKGQWSNAADQSGSGVLDKNDPNYEDPPLLVDGKLSSALTSALTEVFNTFDANNDGELDDGELDKYAVALYGQKLNAREKDGIKAYSPSSTGVNLAAFLAYYRDRTIDRESDTLSDLNTLGYDSDLKKA